MRTPSFERNIDRAKTRFALYGRTMLADEHFQGLVAEYRRAIQSTQQVMQELSLISICGNCAAQEHGSCCAKEVEDWYDDWLLFLNLLMGVEIDYGREAPGHCQFVGPRGCKLAARHSFCGNFLCPEIVASLKPGDKQSLLAACGTELSTGWNLERQARVWLANNPETT